MSKERLKNILILIIAVGGIVSTYAITVHEQKVSENMAPELPQVRTVTDSIR